MEKLTQELPKHDAFHQEEWLEDDLLRDAVVQARAAGQKNILGIYISNSMEKYHGIWNIPSGKLT